MSSKTESSSDFWVPFPFLSYFSLWYSCKANQNRCSCWLVNQHGNWNGIFYVLSNKYIGVSKKNDPFNEIVIIFLIDPKAPHFLQNINILGWYGWYSWLRIISFQCTYLLFEQRHQSLHLFQQFLPTFYVSFIFWMIISNSCGTMLIFYPKKNLYLFSFTYENTITLVTSNLI